MIQRWSIQNVSNFRDSISKKNLFVVSYLQKPKLNHNFEFMKEENMKQVSADKFAFLVTNLKDTKKKYYP